MESHTNRRGKNLGLLRYIGSHIFSLNISGKAHKVHKAQNILEKAERGGEKEIGMY